MEKKRVLLKMVFDRARKEIPQGSITTLAAYLSAHFEERFGYTKNERTFVRYHKNIVVDHSDHSIDQITLDQLSAYLGFKNFAEFTREVTEEETLKNPLKVTVTDGEQSVSSISETLSNIAIQITHSPVFNFPQFLSQHKNGFGLAGIFLIAGVFALQSGYLKTGLDKSFSIITPEKRTTLEQRIDPAITTPARIAELIEEGSGKTEISVPSVRKECMYWDEDHYEPVYCGQKIQGAMVIAYDSSSEQLLRKINRPDTLTVQNAIGKVWYDKSDNQLEFFTSYGIHPVNGKTLKPLTKTMIENHLE